MKRKYLPAGLFVLIIPLFLVPGCRSGNKRSPVTIDDTGTGEVVDRIEAIKQVYHLCPSPAEMLSVIDVAGMDFDRELLISVANADKYLDTKSATLALGMYITDLAYTALFGRHEETLDYLEIAGYIAGQLRLGGAVSEELIRKARDNIGHLDSLFSVSNEAFVNLMTFCEMNERTNTVILMSAGAFIESLYLAVNLVDEYEDAGYLMQYLAEQKYALDNLTVFAESVSGEEDHIQSLLEDMRTLRKIYEDIEAGSREVTVSVQDAGSEDTPKKLVIGGGESSPPTLNPSEFENLKQETIRLRTRLLEG